MIPGGQDLSRRHTVFFLPTDPRDESHKDPEHIDFSVPRIARYVHNAWKRHQDAVFQVDIDLAIREGLTFYQTRSNAIILQGILPAYCIPKVERLKTGEMLYERPYLSPRPPPKISLKHDHNWTKGNDQLGSTVEQHPVGKLAQQSLGEAPRAESSKPIQSKPNPICDRTVKPVETERVFVEKRKTSHSQENVGKRLQEELGSSDRTGKSVKCEDNRVMNVHDRTGKLVESSTHTVQEFDSPGHRDTASSDANKFNLATDEENIDFNIPGVPNSIVKRSHGVNVHNLIQKIENHPQRQALQSDLQQHRAFNPFSRESQDAIKAAGNTELCEIVDVEPKAQCRACLRRVGTLASSSARAGTSCEMIRKRTRSTSSPCWICSPSQTFTSGKAGHTVTGTGRKKVIKNTTRQINFKRSVERNNTRTFTIDLSVIYGSERL